MDGTRTSRTQQRRTGKSGLFEPQGTTLPARTRRLYAVYEIAYTLVDFLAALAFIVGSVLFFYAALQTAGTWLFLVGSILFAVRPTIRLMRELALLAEGGTEDVAERAER